MRVKTIVSVLSVLVLLVAAAASGADTGSWRQVEVTLADGAVFRNVTLSWDETGRALRILRSDGAERRVRLAEIVSVRDRSGAELREEVGAGHGVTTPAPPQGNPEIGTSAPLVRGAPVLERPNPWYFNWMFGLGSAAVRSFGGDFPNGRTVYPLTTSLRRRISRTWFLNLSTASEVHLATQYVPWWEDDTVDLRVEWREEKMILSAGRYSPGSLFCWEAGPAALKRLNYVKFGFRVQAGKWLSINDTWAINTAGYFLLKPGFKDAGGGMATELGLKFELLAR